VSIFPGVITSTDINQALVKGLNILKFFPAEVAGGVNALKAIGGPYLDAAFVTALPDNPLADACIRFLRGYGVDTSFGVF